MMVVAIIVVADMTMTKPKNAGEEEVEAVGLFSQAVASAAAEVREVVLEILVAADLVASAAVAADLMVVVPSGIGK